jgi:hypothetical protein
MDSNPIKQGLLRSLSWLSVIAWLIVVFIAVGVASSQTSYPAVVGWIVLGMLMGIAAITADRWARVLPGMVGVAALNALYSTVSGHFGLNPPKPIARETAAVMMVALMAGAYLATRYMNRKLTKVDRASLACATGSLLAGLSQEQLTVPATVAIVAFSAAGQGYRRFHRKERCCAPAEK